VSSVAEPAAGHGAHKHRVNDLIYDSLVEQPGSEPVGFFCECSSARCFEPVWLTIAEYETRRRDPAWSARAPGHH
jgi:hypothetical protein